MTTALERIELILDSLAVGVIAVDRESRCELQNAEASRILGVSSDLTRGRPLAEVLSAGHPAVELLEAVLRSERPVSAHASELPQRLGRSALVADLAAAPVRGGGDTDGAVLTLRDRTVGWELETIEDRRARNEEFALLAAGIAHEVRNPLSGIRGAAELLQSKLRDPKLQRYPELIRAETDRIRRLLDDLSQITAGGELRRRSVNLHRVLDDLIELQRHSDDWCEIDLVREYDPSIPELELDPDRISQVLLNLLSNAVQAVEGKGRIVVRTRFEHVRHSSPDARQRTPIVTIEIEDSGPGIAPEDREHVFTPFFTRRESGTGLGLAIAQHWTILHGGHIAALASEGGGSRMRVSLPARTA